MRVVFGGLVIDSIENEASCGGEGLEEIVIVLGSLCVSAGVGDCIGELECSFCVGLVEQVGCGVMDVSIGSSCDVGGGELALVGDLSVCCLSFCLLIRIVFLLGSRVRFLTGVRGCEGAFGHATGGGDICPI